MPSPNLEFQVVVTHAKYPRHNNGRLQYYISPPAQQSRPSESDRQTMFRNTNFNRRSPEWFEEKVISPAVV